MRRAALPLLLTAVLVLAACGDDAPTGPDQSSATPVFHAAQAALHDGDWTTLQKLLTNDARIGLEGDMLRIQKNLAEPAKAPMLHKVARSALGDAYEAEVQKAVDGGMPELLRFFVTKLSPRPRVTKPVSMRLDQRTGSLTLEYMTDKGVRRPIKLIRMRGLWFVSSLQL